MALNENLVSGGARGGRGKHCNLHGIEGKQKVWRGKKYTQLNGIARKQEAASTACLAQGEAAGSSPCLLASRWLQAPEGLAPPKSCNCWSRGCIKHASLQVLAPMTLQASTT